MKICIIKGIVIVSLMVILFSCLFVWVVGKGGIGFVVICFVYLEGEE